MSEAPFSLHAARQLDEQDPLGDVRERFHIPRLPDGSAEVYLVGNSLGLQPTSTADYVAQELAAWREKGVRGHFEGDFPWMPYHEFLTPAMAPLVGAKQTEVVMMNSLSANLHLMLATFFRPAGRRCKILIEEHAFPSDYHVVHSQLKWHGLDPGQCLLQVAPDQDGCFSTGHLVETIERHREELALILLPGVQYYTGQWLDIPTITAEARRLQIPIGFDLAHAAGNVPLQLHDWNVDFAAWCTYKYLNSGPGSVGGCFVHERHATDRGLGRLAGWWGHDKQSRFQMKNEFIPIPTAEGWQLSNPPILSLAAIRAALTVFQDVGGIEPLRVKSVRLTRFLEGSLAQCLGDQVRIITPSDPDQRGCQLSLEIQTPGVDGRQVYEALEAQGFRTDWREPRGIRCAPVPLYNSFADAWRFAEGLAAVCKQQASA